LRRIRVDRYYMGKNSEMEKVKIEFTVPGNPVPYLRMTQGQIKLMRIPDHRLDTAALKVKERIRRYLTWKDWVCVRASGLQFDRSPKSKTRVDVMLYFASGKHGDGDNYFKGICDAIFTNDNKVVGSFDYAIDKENPRVEVSIQSADDLVKEGR
jgi:Holliday junction resolvase RusA-like endonuclease